MIAARHGPQRFESVFATASSSRPGALANHANANTKGIWTEIDAATAFPVGGFMLSALVANAALADDHLIDVGVGAAASEVVILANVHHSAGSTLSPLETTNFPLALPQGVRIAMRKQSTTAAAAVFPSILLYSAGMAGSLYAADTYGANTADSGGVSVDPGAMANTKGSYSEITAATTRRIKKLVLCFGNQENNVRTTTDWLVDVAVGAGGSEIVIIPNQHVFASSATDWLHGIRREYNVDIPAGVRLAARAQCATTDATDRLFDVVLIGVG